MAAKKVIEIDVQDGAFKRFAAAFDAFSQALKRTPEEIAALNKAVEKGATAAAKGADKETEAVKKRTAAKKTEATVDATAAKAKDEDRKRDEKRERERIDAANKQATLRKKNREEDSKAARDLAKWTADIAWNTGKAALGFAKWATIGGIATGFGLGGIASGASNARRQSQGIGIDSGELRAAQVNFGKYIDPEAMLDNIANAKSSFASQNLFGRVGVNPAGKDPAALLAEMLPKLVRQFKAVGGMEEPANAMGLTAFASMADLRRLSSLTSQELTATIKAYQQDRERLKVDDATNRDWQSFLVSIHRAGQLIETSLIKHLAVLAPQLEKFGAAIAKSIDTFLSNHDLAKWLDSFAAAIQKAANYLGSDEFQSDIGKFMHAIHKVATLLGKVFDDDPDKDSPAAAAAAGKPLSKAGAFAAAGHVYGAAWDHLTGDHSLAAINHNPGNLRVPGSKTQFQKFASDDEGLKAMANQLLLYEDRDGLDTISKIIAKYAPASENDTKGYIAAVSQRMYGTDPNAHLNLHDSTTMASLVAAMAKQENAKSNFTTGGVKVVIENNTGGNAATSVAALAH